MKCWKKITDTIMYRLCIYNMYVKKIITHAHTQTQTLRLPRREINLTFKIINNLK